ncbi:MAG: DUF4190 domain-containing protein [Anaerolineales bacterium]
MSDYTPPSQPMAPAPQNSTTALLSLIAGIAGLTIFPIIGSIVAVVTGHMAKNEIRRSGGMLGGEGAATWGLILGYIGIGLTVLGVCLAIGIVALSLLGAFFTIQGSSWAPWLLPLLT